MSRLQRNSAKLNTTFNNNSVLKNVEVVSLVKGGNTTDHVSWANHHSATANRFYHIKYTYTGQRQLETLSGMHAADCICRCTSNPPYDCGMVA